MVTLNKQDLKYSHVLVKKFLVFDSVMKSHLNFTRNFIFDFLNYPHLNYAKRNQVLYLIDRNMSGQGLNYFLAKKES